MSVMGASAQSARETEQRERIIATAERLFREIGFQKTTVADIARELRMSPANVYRFFSAKSEINAAVARQLMSEVEEAAQSIARGPGTASERLRALILSNESMNAERYVADRKLHDMVEAALDENWPIISDHIDRIDAAIEEVIRSGMESGEFAKDDAQLAARLVHTSCIRFCHPRLMVECADRPTPTSAQMIEFCIAALRGGFRDLGPALPR
ncbi:TetR family transcriptional regulator [Methylocystis sp. B8]|uniref:TetR/AcrR family transcriptional regulator n=1 Tax=Methylocystis sp. B8 TaxID=544938 RepID=UPI0010FE2187|nr:TetR family transcriptional regulator [Methylocystis sp. B8]TLG78531.1 TetR/AcrR family transcriptional regulator [Methylocystis sp. B8]